MTTTTTHPTTVGERVELARYTTTGAGERVVIGQRVNGVVRLVDVPATGRGRTYLIERELERDGYAALQALLTDTPSTLCYTTGSRWSSPSSATSNTPRRETSAPLGAHRGESKDVV